jgi:hypothetical protein
VHQVRLAETDPAVDEQRVVCTTRILADLDRCGARELIALAFDEAHECEIRVEPAADLWRRLLAPQPPVVARDAHAGCRPATRADLEYDLGRRRGNELLDELTDAVRAVLADPVDDVAVGREQPQASVVLDRLQRTDPRVEMLLRQFGLEPTETLIPERSLHNRRAFYGTAKEVCSAEGARVYTASRAVDISFRRGRFTVVPVDAQRATAYPSAPIFRATA